MHYLNIMVESEEAAMMAMMTESIVFVDSDESGTLTTGDFVMINNATLGCRWRVEFCSPILQRSRRLQ